MFYYVRNQEITSLLKISLYFSLGIADLSLLDQDNSAMQVAIVLTKTSNLNKRPVRTFLLWKVLLSLDQTNTMEFKGKG